jgi:hypothetical protein
MSQQRGDQRGGAANVFTDERSAIVLHHVPGLDSFACSEP